MAGPMECVWRAAKANMLLIVECGTATMSAASGPMTWPHGRLEQAAKTHQVQMQTWRSNRPGFRQQDVRLENKTSDLISDE
ncbi:hypothetical protein [Mesorhizobium sp. M0408]|uniref:hypothetical protein n=1 Tax=Mesorhizobium sp. M0408 TaxID=2956942 RepID=UPI003334A955